MLIKFIKFISVCLQISITCTQPTKTSVPPTMEPYNETHLKVYFENSFEGLPEQYVAVLSLIQPENPRPRVRAIINKSFVKSSPCDMMEDKSLFFVEIFTEERKDILEDTEPLIQSEGFQYDPNSNSNIKRLIENYVCAVNSETARIDIAEIRKNDKYLEYCLLRIKINNVTINGTDGEKKEIQIEKEELLLIESVFSIDKPNYVTIEKKDLENCSNMGRNIAIAIAVPISLMVMCGVFLFCRRERIENNVTREDNTLYGVVTYDDDYKTSELKETNEYYESDYKYGSEVSDVNTRYSKRRV